MEVIKSWVEEVETLFQTVDSKIIEFRNFSGLTCPAFCSECCKKGDIKATVLEFLPLAWHVFNKGEQDLWTEKLMGAHESEPCVLLKPGEGKSGGCSVYPHRSLICRLYGFSYYKCKGGDIRLIACAYIKNNFPLWARIDSKYVELWHLPIAGQYGLKLSVIAPDIGKKLYPVNTTTKRVLNL